MKIALVLFAYKRPKYLKKALETHIKLDMSYYAFVDKSEMQKEVVDIIHDSHLYDMIIPRKTHYGLNENIKSGIDFVFQLDYDAVIVLEDDLLLSNDAIFYLMNGLREFPGKVQAISCDKGEMEDRFKCWAWGTWKGVWENIDWDLVPKEKNRGSWDVIVAENFKQKNWACRCSKWARVKHIGWSGVHYNYLDLFSVRRLLRKLFSH